MKNMKTGNRRKGRKNKKSRPFSGDFPRSGHCKQIM
jgi:hypothetical protein